MDSAIVELRGKQKPEKYLLTALEAVMILLQKPTDWQSIQAEMKTPNILIRQLQKFEKENIPEEVIEKIGEFIEEADIDLEEVK